MYSLEGNIPTPNIRSIHDGGIHADIDPLALSSSATELDISDTIIDRTTVILDGRNRIGIKGIAYPAFAAKLRFPSIANDIDGPVIRLSTIMRGHPRSDEEINQTAIHELEHSAQTERQDPRLLLGNVAIYGGMLVGGLAGNILAKNHSSLTRTAATLLGAAIGKQVGYRQAPHEIQARQTSKQIHTKAITTLKP